MPRLISIENGSLLGANITAGLWGGTGDWQRGSLRGTNSYPVQPQILERYKSMVCVCSQPLRRPTELVMRAPSLSIFHVSGPQPTHTAVHFPAECG